MKRKGPKKKLRKGAFNRKSQIFNKVREMFPGLVGGTYTGIASRMAKNAEKYGVKTFDEVWIFRGVLNGARHVGTSYDEIRRDYGKRAICSELRKAQNERVAQILRDWGGPEKFIRQFEKGQTFRV